MEIEVWSDYVCPFCYIGKRELERAINTLGLEEKVEVQMKSFLLDPTTPEDSEESVYETLAKKYRMPIEEAKKMTQSVANRAKEVGLEYNFDNMKNANTSKSHRLMKWAETKGKEKELCEKLFHAYFIEGKHIGKKGILLSLVEEVGLDVNEAEEILNSNIYNEEVEQDIKEAMQLGVRGVPFFVINNKYGISGAQPQSLFKEAIEKAAKEEGLIRNIEMVGEGPTCTDESCDL